MLLLVLVRTEYTSYSYWVRPQEGGSSCAKTSTIRSARYSPWSLPLFTGAGSCDEKMQQVGVPAQNDRLYDSLLSSHLNPCIRKRLAPDSSSRTATRAQVSSLEGGPPCLNGTIRESCRRLGLFLEKSLGISGNNISLYNKTFLVLNYSDEISSELRSDSSRLEPHARN